jgi:hypothetical protein
MKCVVLLCTWSRLWSHHQVWLISAVWCLDGNVGVDKHCQQAAEAPDLSPSLHPIVPILFPAAAPPHLVSIDQCVVHASCESATQCQLDCWVLGCQVAHLYGASMASHVASVPISPFARVGTAARRGEGEEQGRPTLVLPWLGSKSVA